MIYITINANHGVDFPIRVMQTMTPNDVTSLLNESINLSSRPDISDDELMLEIHKNISYEYIYNGRLLNSYISLASQGVTDGSRIELISKININNINSNKTSPQVSRNILHLEGDDSSIKNSVYASNVNNLIPKLAEDTERFLKLKILEKKARTFSTQSEKIASLLTESFRIYDGHFSSIERYPRSQISYQRMLQMVHNETEDEPDQEPELVDELNNNENPYILNSIISNENMNKSIITKNTNNEPSTDPLPTLNLNSDCDESEEFDEFIMAPLFESIEQAGKLFAKNPWSEWTW